MADKILKSRIVHKHDIEANWLLATNFVPKQGEMIVYDIEVDAEGNILTLPSNRTEPYTYERMKIGDGKTPITLLPFVDDALRDALISEIDNISALVGDVAVSEQIDNAVNELKQRTLIVSATSDDGVAFMATVDGIDTLTAGVNFIMVPARASADVSPTLNVNGLGAKYIRRRLSTGATVAEGYVTTWLTKNKPFRVMYDGTQWVVEGHNKPVVADMYGTLSIDKGGTGATDSITALANLGAAPLYTYNTTDLTAGTSALDTGKLYLVYE